MAGRVGDSLVLRQAQDEGRREGWAQDERMGEGKGNKRGGVGDGE